jgi:dethiobiotin synthetase
MAAEALGADPFSIDDLAVEITATAPADTIVLVEGAGGVRSPLARDGDSAALVDRLRPAVVVLVADAELGTINLVRLSAGALVHDSVVVFLNRFDERNELHRRNRAWLRDRDRFDVVTDVEELIDRVARRARP